MFNHIKRYFTEQLGVDNSMATITPLSDGRFGLFDRNNRNLGFYKRRRDAVRGAKRRNLNVL